QQTTSQHPPLVNYVKNLNATLFTEENRAGMDACFRVEQERFLAAMTTHIEANMTTMEAEAWSLNKCINRK
ncbi:hypothetical protein A2U01_0065893, partial [Trifolium medium]|nr:hypothetical protein [Trifolium medium]